MLANSRRSAMLSRAMPGALLVAILVAGWWLYRPALGGAFMLDDWHNLDGLTSIRDLDSALQFVFSGMSGPVGRPLALATFVPQAEHWPGTAEPFLVINVLVHLSNGLLLFLLAWQLSRMRGLQSRDAQLVALATMTLWLCMPLLASASLLVVQRMTTLAALFTLAGLNAYLLFRSQLEAHPRRALTGMSVALLLGSVLAVLAKENGALLPTFVLVLELTLLSPPGSISPGRWRGWQSVFLYVPTAIVLAAVLLQLPYSESTALSQGFTGGERLLTQATVLWTYLLHAFFPQPGALVPFHDSLVAARSLFEWPTLLAVIGWLAVLAAAIRWRREHPVAAFAVLWFLAGHLFESTTVPLYLYFEHRNYVPLIGPVFALCLYAVGYAGTMRNAARGLLAGYIAIHAVVLIGVTSLWGQPLQAATVWYERQPDSPTAAGFLAIQQATAVSPDLGVQTLRRFADAHPDHAYLRLPELTLACRTRPADDHRGIAATLQAALPNVAFTIAVAAQLDELFDAAVRNDCAGIDGATVRGLAEAVLDNPRFAANLRYNSLHHRLLAKIAFQGGSLTDAIGELQTAKSFDSDSELHLMFVSLLVSDRRFDDARSYLDEAAEDLPRHPFRRIAAQISLQELRRYVDGYETAIREREASDGAR